MEIVSKRTMHIWNNLSENVKDMYIDSFEMQGVFLSIRTISAAKKFLSYLDKVVRETRLELQEFRRSHNKGVCVKCDNEDIKISKRVYPELVEFSQSLSHDIKAAEMNGVRKCSKCAKNLTEPNGRVICNKCRSRMRIV